MQSPFPIVSIAVANLPASPAKSTIYLVGNQSLPDALRDVYPKWARRFNHRATAIVPIDAPSDGNPQFFSNLVEFLRDEYHVVGLVMVSHADTLFEHTSDQYDDAHEDVGLLGEIGVVLRTPGNLTALAPSKAAARHAYEQTFGVDSDPPEVLIIGGNEQARALALALSSSTVGAEPRRVSLTTLDGKSMTDMRQRVADLPEGQRPVLRHIETQIEHDRLVTLLPPGSLVVNASGPVPADAPSPVGPAALFPENGLVWDLDAVGISSPFLDKARAQRSERGLRLADGPMFHRYQWIGAANAIFGASPDAAEMAKMLTQIG